MSNHERIYRSFIEHPKSLIIAPAGFGKTHTIAESIKLSEGHQLILTHTNAGVAAIKEKIRKIGCSTSYSVETISGFAQRYVKSFSFEKDIPEQDSNEYFPWIIETAIDLFKKNLIKKIIKVNYDGLFVDEYQDCTKSQHALTSVLSELLPTHILGDPLQGIFDFNNDPLVNFNDDLGDYHLATELKTPWRWEGTNPELGADLRLLRQDLENNKRICLSSYESIENHLVAEKDLYVYGQIYNSTIRRIIATESSVLIIYPISHNLNARAKIIRLFNNSFYLVEAMDGKEFYSLSKQIDSANFQNIYSILLDISQVLFSKGKVKNWLGEKKLINKRSIQDRLIVQPLKETFNELTQNFSIKLIPKALKLIKQLPQNKCYRTELYYDLCKAMENASLQEESVFDSMKKMRDKKRHMGRRIGGKCIGTTLLTKGLEFDTVIILDAHRFDCLKNFYVATTRASKRLIIFSSSDEITFS